MRPNPGRPPFDAQRDGTTPCHTSQQIPISVPNLPSIQIILVAGGETGDRFGFCIGELAMVPAQPRHSTLEELDGSSLHDDFADDECGDDDFVSLLEENARLRKLVLSLSEIILRNAADAK